MSILQTMIGLLASDASTDRRELDQAGAARLAGQLADAHSAIAAEQKDRPAPDKKGDKQPPDYQLKTLQAAKQRKSNLDSEYYQTIELATKIQGKLTANAATRTTADDSARTGTVTKLAVAKERINMSNADRNVLILADALGQVDKGRSADLAAVLTQLQDQQTAPADAPAADGPSNGGNGKTAPAASQTAPAAS